MFFGWEQVEKKQVLITLKQIQILFSDPNNWVYWPVAVNVLGKEVSPNHEAAVKWSLMGACDLFTGKQYDSPLSGFIGCALREYLNDMTDDKLIHGSLNYEDECALIDLAIEDLENE